MFDITSLMSDASRQASERPKYEAVRLPIGKLYPDPANRKVYGVEKIEELADSIELAGGKTLAAIDEHEPVGHKSEPEAVPPAIGPDRHDIDLKTQMGALRYVQRELDRMHVGMLVRKTPAGEEEELGTVRMAINREVDELLDIIQVKLECCHASMVNAMRGDK